MANIPDDVRAQAEFAPSEDVVVTILKAGLPQIEINSAIRKNQTFPCVTVRRLPTFLVTRGDERFLDTCDMSIHVFTEDPNGDQDASVLSEVCRVLLRDAWLNGWSNPNLGFINHFEVISAPRRVPDWATSTGPVQYADLPSNVHRYEGRYRLIVRKPRNRPFPLP